MNGWFKFGQVSLTSNRTKLELKPLEAENTRLGELLLLIEPSWN